MSLKRSQSLQITREQVIQYLNKIEFNESQLNDSSDLPLPTLETLTRIFNQQVKTIAFGGLSLVYHKSSSTPIEPFQLNSLDPYSTRGINVELDAILYKLIHQSREGYCFEQNILVRVILQFLGFETMMSTARLIDFGLLKQEKKVEIVENDHVIVVVKVDGKRYLVDAGFGPEGPSHPIDLDSTEFTQGEGRMQHRIVNESPNEPGYKITSLHQQSYLLQVRTLDSTRNNYRPWSPIYFTNLSPTYPKDIQVLNFYINHSPNSLFNNHIIMAKYIDRGQITLFDNRLRIYQDGIKIKDEILDTETKRRACYKDQFKVELDLDLKEYLPKGYAEVDF